MHSKRYAKCNPRGMTLLPKRLNPIRGIFFHTSWSAFHTSYRCRLGHIPLGLHVICLGLHLHTSWVTLGIPLGIHSIPLGSHPWGPYLLGYTIPLGVYIPRGMKCNPRGIPQIHTSWVYLLGCRWFYRCRWRCLFFPQCRRRRTKLYSIISSSPVTALFVRPGLLFLFSLWVHPLE